MSTAEERRAFHVREYRRLYHQAEAENGRLRAVLDSVRIHFDEQPMLTPDEESLLECIQRTLHGGE